MAERIKRTYPDEDLVAGDLIAVMLRSGLQAMELSQPALIIDFIFPQGAPSEDPEKAEAHLN